ncbi:hypothetical protein M9H77_22486 [Catharanthus roseus]|uniref:Uncharacterized protein n=1 Tax=Catharanthus roseus TaxID=4058 RepID=A0ACC0AQA9_CATRO|nr:hypothetical protein M9H77_22486 [Catharanthus roseus]
MAINFNVLSPLVEDRIGRDSRAGIVFKRVLFRVPNVSWGKEATYLGKESMEGQAADRLGSLANKGPDAARLGGKASSSAIGVINKATARSWATKKWSAGKKVGIRLLEWSFATGPPVVGLLEENTVGFWATEGGPSKSCACVLSSGVCCSPFAAASTRQYTVVAELSCTDTVCTGFGPTVEVAHQLEIPTCFMSTSITVAANRSQGGSWRLAGFCSGEEFSLEFLVKRFTPRQLVSELEFHSY